MATGESGDKKRILKIDDQSIRLVQSGLVITSLATAVKELVENGLDSGARNVEVKLVDFGREQILVSDDGSGIPPEDFPFLGMVHHTSKLSGGLDNLTKVESFGFRGEAIHALCVVSKVSILTRHSTQDMGTKLELENDGTISQMHPPRPHARVRGTTVTLRDLFYSMPVRQKDFASRSKKEFDKMTTLITGYAIGSKGTRITVSNSTGGQLKTSLRVSGRSIKDNIIEIFGPKQFEELIPFKQASQPDEENSIFRPELRISGYVSKCDTGCGRGSSEREFYSLNGRPCDMPSLARVIHEVYRIYNRNKYPFVYLDIRTSKDDVDVNVSPDKRKLLLRDEYHLHAIVRQSLMDLYKTNISTTTNDEAQISFKAASSFTAKPISMSLKDFVATAKRVPSYQPMKRPCEDISQSHQVEEQIDRQSKTFRRATSPADDCFQSPSSPISETAATTPQSSQGMDNSLSFSEKLKLYTAGAPRINASANMSIASSCDARESSHTSEVRQESGVTTKPLDRANKTADIQLGDFLESILREPKVDNPPNPLVENDNPVPSAISLDSDAASNDRPRHISEVTLIDDHEESPTVYTTDNYPMEKRHRSSIHVFISMDEIERRVRHLTDGKRPADSQRSTEDELLSESDPRFRAQMSARAGSDSQARADNEIQRVLSRDEFRSMEIIGQFNKAFLLVHPKCKSNTNKTDVYIIDQHASGERQNFERLLRETRLKGHPLIAPQRLELTPTAQSIIFDNIELFERWGFTFTAEIGASSSHKRLLLSRAPQDGAYLFDNRDIDELVGVIQENSPQFGRTYLLSKFKTMVASRACRTAIMVGESLTRRKAADLVKGMAPLEQPWICAHGRPSIRHLISL